MNETRLTAADVARIADLDPSTVEDWTRRGVVPTTATDYTRADALRFTVVRSPMGHGVPVFRAAETLRRIEETQAQYWRAALDECARGEAHVYIFTVFYNSQAFGVFLYAGDSRTADAFIQNSMADGTAGEFVDASVPDYPVPEGAPPSRVARYDIGPDLRRAFREMGSAA